MSVATGAKVGAKIAKKALKIFSRGGDDAARGADKVGEAADKAADAAKATTKRSRLKKPLVVAGLGGAGYGGVRLFSGDAEPSYGEFTPPTPKLPGTSANDYIAQQRQVLENMYSQLKPSYPGQEMYDSMSGVNTQLAGASTAAMNELAGQYAKTAADIKAGGQQGAAAINDIYGQGGQYMSDVASAPSGEFGGMVPVSGAAALAPSEQQAAGANLANYLAQNQLISAQTQGGMAELAQMLGPAYSNQFALMDAQARAQAEARKASSLADFTNRMAMERAQTMGEFELGALETMRNEEERQRQLEALYRAASMPQNVKQYADEYENGLTDADRRYLANNFGIRDAEEYAQFQIEQAVQTGQME
jgi:hypothetical protein